MKESTTQYIRLIEDLEFDDLTWGRRTLLTSGAEGFILDEYSIAFLPGATAEKKQKMIEEMMEAFNQNRIYALVRGYPCSLSKDSFVLLEKSPMFCIGELV